MDGNTVKITFRDDEVVTVTPNRIAAALKRLFEIFDIGETSVDFSDCDPDDARDIQRALGMR